MDTAEQMHFKLPVSCLGNLPGSGSRVLLPALPAACFIGRQITFKSSPHDRIALECLSSSQRVGWLARLHVGATLSSGKEEGFWHIGRERFPQPPVSGWIWGGLGTCTPAEALAFIVSLQSDLQNNFKNSWTFFFIKHCCEVEYFITQGTHHSFLGKSMWLRFWKAEMLGWLVLEERSSWTVFSD